MRVDTARDYYYQYYVVLHYTYDYYSQIVGIECTYKSYQYDLNKKY